MFNKIFPIGLSHYGPLTIFSALTDIKQGAIKPRMKTAFAITGICIIG